MYRNNGGHRIIGTSRSTSLLVDFPAIFVGAGFATRSAETPSLHSNSMRVSFIIIFCTIFHVEMFQHFQSTYFKRSGLQFFGRLR